MFPALITLLFVFVMVVAGEAGTKVGRKHWAWVGGVCWFDDNVPTPNMLQSLCLAATLLSHVRWCRPCPLDLDHLSVLDSDQDGQRGKFRLKEHVMMLFPTLED